MRRAQADQLGRSSGLTITEIAATARRPETGADRVTIKDASAAKAGVRTFDQVTIKVGKEVIEVLRSGPSDPWIFQAIGPPEPRRAHVTELDAGMIVGVGDVVRAVHAARERQGLPAPKGGSESARAWGNFRAMKNPGDRGAPVGRRGRVPVGRTRRYV